MGGINPPLAVAFRRPVSRAGRPAGSFRDPMRRFRFAVLAAVAAACARAGTVTPTPAPSPLAAKSAVRVHATASGTDIPFDALVAAAARADLVFFGEQHDDPETHFIEFALLEAIGRVRPNVVVSLEMFERDVQPLLDGYLAGRISEADFLRDSRPWDRYATDYRSLVVLARARGWPVIASNTPRPLANAVSRVGLAVLDTLNVASRAHVARDISCPHDAYYARFAEQMTRHGPTGPSAAPDTAAMRAMTQRYYEAQCIKDETMGESIAAAYRRAGPGAIVVHFNGAFHSDYGYGAAERARRRLPGVTSVVVTAVPVGEPASAVPEVAGAGSPARGDYLVFVRRPTR